MEKYMTLKTRIQLLCIGVFLIYTLFILSLYSTNAKENIIAQTKQEDMSFEILDEKFIIKDRKYLVITKIKNTGKYDIVDYLNSGINVRDSVSYKGEYITSSPMAHTTRLITKPGEVNCIYRYGEINEDIEIDDMNNIKYTSKLYINEKHDYEEYVSERTEIECDTLKEGAQSHKHTEDGVYMEVSDLYYSCSDDNELTVRCKLNRISAIGGSALDIAASIVLYGKNGEPIYIGNIDNKYANIINTYTEELTNSDCEDTRVLNEYELEDTISLSEYGIDYETEVEDCEIVAWYDLYWFNALKNINFIF